MTFTGIVYSKDCGNSTALLDRATHEEVSLGNISRVVVSPDGMKLAGVSYLPSDRSSEQLVVVDLASGETAIVETVETPDQVVWGETGTSELFYSTRQMTTSAPESPDAELERLDAVLDNRDQLNLWEMSIHHVDLATSIDTEIYRAEAYAIGRMNAVAGRLDDSDPNLYLDSESLVPVQLFRLRTDGEGELLGKDLHKVAAIMQ